MKRRFVKVLFPLLFAVLFVCNVLFLIEWRKEGTEQQITTALKTVLSKKGTLTKRGARSYEVYSQNIASDRIGLILALLRKEDILLRIDAVAVQPRVQYDGFSLTLRFSFL